MLKQLLGLFSANSKVSFVGRNYNGLDEVVKIPAPSNQSAGYYEFEYLQDGGGGVMLCAPVIYAESYRDAVENGIKHAREQNRTSCQFAYGNLPERVRRLPNELQSFSKDEAKARWQEHPDYNAPIRAEERINPWRLGPVRSGRSGW